MGKAVRALAVKQHGIEVEICPIPDSAFTRLHAVTAR